MAVGIFLFKSKPAAKAAGSVSGKCYSLDSSDNYGSAFPTFRYRWRKSVRDGRRRFTECASAGLEHVMACGTRSQDDGIWIAPDRALTNAWVGVVRLNRDYDIVFAAEGRVTNGPGRGSRSQTDRRNICKPALDGSRRGSARIHEALSKGRSAQRQAALGRTAGRTRRGEVNVDRLADTCRPPHQPGRALDRR